MLNVDIKMPDGEVTGATQLPDPSGFKLLIALPELEEKTDGGVYLPEQVRNNETLATVVGFVLKAGPMAYGDEKKFPTEKYLLPFIIPLRLKVQRKFSVCILKFPVCC